MFFVFIRVRSVFHPWLKTVLIIVTSISRDVTGWEIEPNSRRGSSDERKKAERGTKAKSGNSVTRPPDKCPVALGLSLILCIVTRDGVALFDI